jgi:methyltransferase family protein
LASLSRILSNLRFRLFLRGRVQTWNLAYDLRFGEILRGDVATRFSELGAERSSNVSYYALSLIFKGETIAADDVLVDVGCGKGRMINWWLSRQLPNQIVGLELDPEIAARTRHRLRKYRNVTIVTGDGPENLPTDGSLFFLYNPFQKAVVSRFKERILQLPRRDRIRIYYYYCLHVDVFENDPSFSIEYLDLIPDDCSASRRETLERFLEPAAIIRLKAADDSGAIFS